MTTIHSYTNDQKPRSSRIGYAVRKQPLSMIPPPQELQRSVVLPGLRVARRFAIRVPTPDVSLVDLTVQTVKPATDKTVNQAFKLRRMVHERDTPIHR
jgi:glyceraldehyde 3-phosphate dehydrogenase